MNIRKLFPCLATVLLLASLSATVFAQGRASLRGVINDEFGASIVGAAVTLTVTVRLTEPALLVAVKV